MVCTQNAKKTDVKHYVEELTTSKVLELSLTPDR